MTIEPPFIKINIFLIVFNIEEWNQYVKKVQLLQYKIKLYMFSKLINISAAFVFYKFKNNSNLSCVWEIWT